MGGRNMFLLVVEKVATVNEYTCGALEDFVFSGTLPRLTALIITIIQVGVPILLIFFGMLDLGKAVMAQKEDEIKKGQQVFVKRLIAAVLVFLVIFVVKTVVGAVSSEAGITSCINCFTKGEVYTNACVQINQ